MRSIVPFIWSFLMLLALVLRPPDAAAAGEIRQNNTGEKSASPSHWRPWHRWVRPASGKKVTFFPLGDLFAPPIADQRQPRFYATRQAYNTNFGHYKVGSVGFGENIGLFRWPGPQEGNGWQLGLSAAALSIFNLDSASYDLLNTDYIIGFPLSFRTGHWSARARIFHQSSHLGDEFLLNSQPIAMQRINLSFEELEFLGSWDWNGWRLYGGASRILSTITPLDKNRVQGGLEFRSDRFLPGGGRFIPGYDLSAWDETSWSGSSSLKTGVMFQSSHHGARSLRVLGEYYSGRVPHGQFYHITARYFGFGISFSL